MKATSRLKWMMQSTMSQGPKHSEDPIEVAP
jgi:hypothetical protein